MLAIIAAILCSVMIICAAIVCWWRWRKEKVEKASHVQKGLEFSNKKTTVFGGPDEPWIKVIEPKKEGREMISQLLLPPKEGETQRIPGMSTRLSPFIEKIEVDGAIYGHLVIPDGSEYPMFSKKIEGFEILLEATFSGEIDMDQHDKLYKSLSKLNLPS